MRIFVVPVENMFRVGALLTNLYHCMYKEASGTAGRFDCPPPDLEEYLVTAFIEG
jgi:hypothetical protein